MLPFQYLLIFSTIQAYKVKVGPHRTVFFAPIQNVFLKTGKKTSQNSALQQPDPCFKVNLTFDGNITSNAAYYRDRRDAAYDMGFNDNETIYTQHLLCVKNEIFVKECFYFF